MFVFRKRLDERNDAGGSMSLRFALLLPFCCSSSSSLLLHAKPEKQQAFETNDIYNKIWNLYKHTDEERERKGESRVEGNHVRKVVKPQFFVFKCW